MQVRHYQSSGRHRGFGDQREGDKVDLLVHIFQFLGS